MRRHMLPLTIVFALLLGSCATGGPIDDDTTTTEPIDDGDPGGTTEPTEPDDSQVTIRFLDQQPTNPEDVQTSRDLVDEFMAENPDIIVELDFLTLDQLKAVLQTQLQSGEGPDVFRYGPGPGFSGPLADAGLLHDLSDAYESNGWQFYDWALDQVTVNDELIMVPDKTDVIGVYYNQDLFEEYEVEPPATIDELRSVAGTFQEGGIVPIAFSDGGGWEGGHMLSVALSSQVGSAAMAEYINGTREWSDGEVVDAIERTFQEFNEADYYPDGVTGIDYDTAIGMFLSGEAAMFPTGSWLAATIQDELGESAGFFPYPGVDEPGIYSAGLSSGLFVAESSEHKEEAERLLDFLGSEEATAKRVDELGWIPAYFVTLPDLSDRPLLQSIQEQTQQILNGEGEFGFNIDVFASQFVNQAMFDSIQGVLNDSRTPQDAADAMAQAATE